MPLLSDGGEKEITRIDRNITRSCFVEVELLLEDYILIKILRNDLCAFQFVTNKALAPKGCAIDPNLLAS
jgi:hypothetical protein